MSDIQITSIIFRENLYHLDNCMSNITSSKICGMCRLRRQILLLKRDKIVPILQSWTVQESIQERQKGQRGIKSVLKQKDNWTELHPHLWSCVFEAKNSLECGANRD